MRELKNLHVFGPLGAVRGAPRSRSRGRIGGMLVDEEVVFIFPIRCLKFSEVLRTVCICSLSRFFAH